MPLAVLDDMELGRRIKAGGYTQHAMSGVDMVAIEWYRSTPDLIRGLEKNVFSGFDYRLGTLFAVTLLMLAAAALIAAFLISYSDSDDPSFEWNFDTVQGPAVPGGSHAVDV